MPIRVRTEAAPPMPSRRDAPGGARDRPAAPRVDRRTAARVGAVAGGPTATPSVAATLQQAADDGPRSQRLAPSQTLADASIARRQASPARSAAAAGPTVQCRKTAAFPLSKKLTASVGFLYSEYKDLPDAAYRTYAFDKLQATYYTSLAKGQGYWTTLANALAAWDGDRHDDLAARLAERRRDYDARFAANYVTKVKTQPDGQKQVSTTGREEDGTAPDTAKDIPYSNSVDLTDNSIVAEHNYAERDAARVSDTRHKGDDGWPPRGLPNSEILWQQYRQAASEQYWLWKESRTKAFMAQLAAVKRRQVQNAVTRQTLLFALPDGQDDLSGGHPPAPRDRGAGGTRTANAWRTIDERCAGTVAARRDAPRRQEQRMNIKTTVQGGWRPAAALLAASLAAGTGGAHAAAYLETFSGPLSAAAWQLDAAGNTIDVSGGELVFTRQTGDAAKLQFKPMLVGDFDVRFDYRLIDWGATYGYGDRLQLDVHNLLPSSRGHAVGRYQEGSLFGAVDSACCVFSPPATDRAGSLRITRVDGIVDIAYQDDGTWHHLAHSTVDHRDMTLAFTAYVHRGFNAGTRYAIDNFSIRADAFAQPVPEPATSAMLLAGLGTLGWIARRRRTRRA